VSGAFSLAAERQAAAELGFSTPGLSWGFPGEANKRRCSGGNFWGLRRWQQQNIAMAFIQLQHFPSRLALLPCTCNFSFLCFFNESGCRRNVLHQQ
jgi:hypothetical protein